MRDSGGIFGCESFRESSKKTPINESVYMFKCSEEAGTFENRSQCLQTNGRRGLGPQPRGHTALKDGVRWSLRRMVIHVAFGSDCLVLNMYRSTHTVRKSYVVSAEGAGRTVHTVPCIYRSQPCILTYALSSVQCNGIFCSSAKKTTKHVRFYITLTWARRHQPFDVRPEAVPTRWCMRPLANWAFGLALCRSPF
jgi:hypothetical protein